MSGSALGTVVISAPVVIILVLGCIGFVLGAAILFYSLLHDSGPGLFGKRLVLVFGALKALKDALLFPSMPVLPDSPDWRVTLYDIPIFAFNCSLLYWITDMYVKYDDNAKPNCRCCAPNTRLGAWSREYHCAFFLLLFGVITGLDYLSHIRVDAAPAVLVAVMEVVGILICLILACRVAYLQSDFHFGSQTTRVALPIVRRLRYVVPLCTVDYVIAYGGEYSGLIKTTHIYMPFGGSGNPINWPTFAWVACFNLLPTFLFCVAFAARPASIMLHVCSKHENLNYGSFSSQVDGESVDSYRDTWTPDVGSESGYLDECRSWLGYTHSASSSPPTTPQHQLPGRHTFTPPTTPGQPPQRDIRPIPTLSINASPDD